MNDWLDSHTKVRNQQISLLLFLLSFSLNLWSGETQPHHHGTLSSLNLGIRYSSLLESRGLVLYRDFQIDPVLGVFLFDDRLEFLGDSISYRDFVVGDSLRLRGQLATITDSTFFPSTNSVKDGLVHRPDTYEARLNAELFLPGYNENYKAEIDLSYAKDLSAHFGQYIDFQSKIKMFDYRIPFFKAKIEPQLLTSVGWGDNAHNRYLYGEGANSDSFNNLSYGVWFAFPEQADRYYPIVQIKHFEVIGASRSGAYALGKSEGWLISFIATDGILE